MDKTYSVLDVARYIINYSHDKNYHISNLRLQKLLYFVQAQFLVKHKSNEGCFFENIEAWDFGPVVPEVYHEYKIYGSSDIPKIDEYIDFSNGIWNAEKKKWDYELISECDRNLINEMVDACSNYSATELVDITHNQKPWQQSYVKGLNNVIDNNSIYNFFNKEN